jgi:hypothetical protein
MAVLSRGHLDHRLIGDRLSISEGPLLRGRSF